LDEGDSSEVSFDVWVCIFLLQGFFDLVLIHRDSFKTVGVIDVRDERIL
jgi:hypothetical protein